VDLANSLLTIRNTKFYKSRLVPIGTDLTTVLRDYARWRAVTHPSAGASSTFFIDKRVEPVHRCALDSAFKRLRKHVGLRRSDGGRFQPRLHDLRHNAASRIMPTSSVVPLWFAEFSTSMRFSPLPDAA
jgi:integrase